MSSCCLSKHACFLRAAPAVVFGRDERSSTSPPRHRCASEAKRRARNRGGPSGTKQRRSVPPVATKPRERASCLVSVCDREAASLLACVTQQTRSHLAVVCKPLRLISSLYRQRFQPSLLRRPARLSSVIVAEQAGQCADAGLLQVIFVTNSNLLHHRLAGN